jgi:tetratricopeptide (TPR) repeat protein
MMAVACLCAAALLATGCSKESKKESRLRQADIHFKAGDYDRAEVEYLNALQIESTNFIALRRLGVMAYEEGRLSHAYAALNSAKKTAPEDFDTRLHLALVLLAGGNPKDARAEALTLLNRQETNEQVLMLLAESSLSTNDVIDAQQRLHSSEKACTSLAGFHLAKGTLLIREGKASEAESEFLKALSLDPKSGAAQMSLGNICLMRKDLTNAMVRYKAAADASGARSPCRLRYANFKLISGDSHGARQILEDMSTAAPDYLPALLALAQIDLVERNLAECETRLKNLLHRDPTHQEGLLLMASLQLAQNQPEKALAALQKLLKLFPRLPQAHYQTAQVYLRQNDLANAIKSLNETLRLQPGWIEPALLLAELHIQRGEHTDAINLLTKLTVQRPDLIEAQLLLATAQRTAGNLDSALRIYENIGKNHPNNPQPFFLMGLVLQQQSRNIDARTTYEHALSISPDFFPALEQLVKLDLTEKRLSEARDRAQKEINRTPTNTAPYLLLAKILITETNLDAAESVLIRAAALAPDATAPQALLAQVYVTGHKNEAALKKLTAIVATRTNDMGTWMLIGHLQTASSNYVAARQAYETILAINPQHVPALNNLAYLCSEHLGDPKRAYELGSRAHDLLPNDPNTADTFGWVLYRNGEYARALGLIQESVRRSAQEPEVWFHLGMASYMMGEEADARTALQNALHLAVADSYWRAEAEERLRVLAFDPSNADATAVRFLEGLLSHSSSDPTLQARLAAVSERSGDWQKAAKSYEKALACNTNLVPVMVKLAQLYSSHLNEPERAFELARRARNLDPTDPEVAHTLGRIAFDSARSGADFQWANVLLQESSRHYPDDPEVLYDLAWSAYAVGQTSNAITAMRKAVSVSPPLRRSDQARLFLEMNAVLLTGDSATTTRVAEVLRQQPEYVPALRASGFFKEKQGDNKGALEAYEKVLQVYPLFLPAYKSLAFLYTRAGQEQKAYDFASKAREALPGDREIARLLGGMNYQRGAHAAAVGLLKECAPAFPSDAELFYMLGLAQQKTKLSKESKETLTKALSMDPKSPFATEARTVLAGLK